MRKILVSALAPVLAVTIAALSAQSATAADLTGAELASMFHGKTAYIEFSGDNAATGKGQGAIYYQADGKVAGRLPNGQMRKGMRTIKDNTACLGWDGGPPPICSRLERDGDKVKIIGVDGKSPGTITKIVDGNPEKL